MAEMTGKGRRLLEGTVIMGNDKKKKTQIVGKGTQGMSRVDKPWEGYEQMKKKDIQMV